MGQPSWKSITPQPVRVPDRTGSLWTLALDWLTPGKLYRIEVPMVVPPVAAPAAQAGGAPAAAPPPPDPVDQTWTPNGARAACTADGDATGLSRRDALILPQARLGTLIAKIGGSTADAAWDKDLTTVLAIGRCCVFKAPEEAKTGPLYLTMNDSAGAVTGLTGSLDIVIAESL